MAHALFVGDGDHLRAATAQEMLDRAAALMVQRFRAGAPWTAIAGLAAMP